MAPKQRIARVLETAIWPRPVGAVPTSVFDHMLTPAQMNQLASDVARGLGADFAVVENYPSYTGAAFPGTVKGADGAECGQAGELLRGTDALLPRLVPGMLV